MFRANSIFGWDQLASYLSMPSEREQNKTGANAGLFGLLREALGGQERDLTKEPLNRAVVLLALPMGLELALESVFSVVDIIWVSVLGAAAVAAVGLTESLMTIPLAISAGLGTAITALVARHVGEGDAEKAAVAAVQAIYVGVAVSVLIGLPLVFLAPKLLLIMGASGPVVQIGSTYARITLGLSGVVILLALNNAIFRGAGNAATAMRLLWIANGINLVLDPLLIFGVGPFPKLGVTGPAIATLTGRGIAVIIQIALLLKGSGKLRIKLSQLPVRASEMLQYLRIAGTGTVQFLLEQGSWLFLIRIVSAFGAAAIAGYTIALRIINFVVLPAIGLSSAAGTLVGQNLGAGTVDRARSSVWRTGVLNLIFLGASCAFFLVFAHPLVAVFSKEKAAAPVAVQCLRIFSISNIFFAFSAVFMQAFNGAGDTRTPAYINLFGFWLVEIPLAWLLGRHTELQMRGVFLAVLIAQVVALIASGSLFLKGSWANRQLS